MLNPEKQVQGRFVSAGPAVAISYDNRLFRILSTKTITVSLNLVIEVFL
jgi:hypothetical protein